MESGNRVIATTGCLILGVTLIFGGVFSDRIDEQPSVKAQAVSSVADEMLSCMPPVQVNYGCTRAPSDGVELFEETLYICDTDFEQSAGFETYDWGFTEGVMDDLELCVSQPSEGSNQSFFFMAKIFTCGGQAMSNVVLTSYEYQGGPTIDSWNLGLGSISSPATISTTCYDSCSWPGYLEVTIDSAFIDYVEWYVGCCYCECYSDPCQ